ncbi:MAG: phytoene synthase [Rhodobacteraceae bacterium]|nr:phytoene synthase [Paracoccaceae bacterium]
MIAPDDLEHCRSVIKTGSLSFHAASKLLPSSVRDPALALYAFCRLADDEVDEGNAKGRAVLKLQDRLDLAYKGMPKNAPEDRAFAAIIEEFDMPRALPEALLEGLAWDAVERRYATLSDVRSYSARVASAVGVMMCVLMRVRNPDTLARACDLGIAMQLTNIARDVGEDAHERRIYLPTNWLQDAGIEVEAFFNAPKPTREVRRMVSGILAEAHRLYIRSEAGISGLPLSARSGIFAARYIYAGISGAVRKNQHDSINFRARTSKVAKVKLIGKSAIRAAGTMLLPTSPVIFAKPLPEVKFLVDAAAGVEPKVMGRTESLLNTLAELKSREARSCSSGIAAE